VCLQVFGMSVEGEGEASLSRDETNLIVRATRLGFESCGAAMPPLFFECKNAIPFGAGLGSSSAAIVSGVLAGRALCGKTGVDRDVLQIASQLENHVDNLAPCLFGGMQVRKNSAATC
jgi:homoserine kinase